jgi:hypothetical protein
MRFHYLAIPVLLILFITACSEDDPITPPEDHEEAIGMALFRGDSLVASILRGIPNDTLRIPFGTSTEDYDVRFYDEAEAIFEAHDDENSFSWEIADPTIVNVEQDAGKEGKYEFRFRGMKQGSTTVEFFIMHEGHADFRTGKWPILVR